MSETKLGFEYEGLCHINKSNYYRTPSIPEKYRSLLFNQNTPIDGYQALAELRFKPLLCYADNTDTYRQFFKLVNHFAVKEKVQFTECTVPEYIHKECIDKERWAFTPRLIPKTLIGECIDYRFKEPMTFKDGKLVGWDNPVPYIIPGATHGVRAASTSMEDIVVNAETPILRGGGLHINISPLEPKYCGEFIKALAEQLAPLTCKDFKSKYRVNTLFRYRQYEWEKGVEYMSFGLKLTTEEEFVNTLNAIQLIVKELLDKYK